MEEKSDALYNLHTLLYAPGQWKNEKIKMAGGQYISIYLYIYFPYFTNVQHPHGILAEPTRGMCRFCKHCIDRLEPIRTARN